MRALDTLVAGAGLAQAHDGAPAAAAFVALGLRVPESTLALAVAAVVRVVAAGAAADGAQPEEGCDDGRSLSFFPFGCQRHSAGVRAVHDSDFFRTDWEDNPRLLRVFSLTVSHDER